jgi:hypothetical protein
LVVCGKSHPTTGNLRSLGGEAPQRLHWHAALMSQPKEQTMKMSMIAVALMATIATPAHAESYTYMCRVPNEHKSYPLKIDVDKATLTWRGTTFRNLQHVDGCKYSWQATTSDGVMAEVCTATQGYADLTIGKASFDCDDGRPRSKP